MRPVSSNEASQEPVRHSLEANPLNCAALQQDSLKEQTIMNEFRMGLLKERAAQIRPDLDHVREITEKAEAERRADGRGEGDRRPGHQVGA